MVIQKLTRYPNRELFLSVGSVLKVVYSGKKSLNEPVMGLLPNKVFLTDGLEIWQLGFWETRRILKYHAFYTARMGMTFLNTIFATIRKNVALTFSF